MSGKKIIMIEFLDWSVSTPVGSHQYARYFIDNGYKVCWLCGPISLWHIFNIKQTAGRFGIWAGNGRWMEKDSIFCYVPFAFLPYRNFPFIRSKTCADNALKFTFPGVRSVLKKNGFMDVDIAWITNPVMKGILDIISYRKAFYRVADDLTGFKSLPGTIREVERDVLKRVDIVLSAGNVILDKVRRLRDDVLLLNNGVDYSFFNNDEKAEPSEFKDIRMPRVIYAGSIDTWLDLVFIRKCAERLNEISFVLIGPNKVSVDELDDVPNIYILGAKKREDIPAFMKHSQIGFIPFKKNVLTDSVNPLKLYEYSACGIPTVAVGTEELKRLGSPAFLVDSAEEAVDKIKQLLKEGNKRKEEYKTFARENSWDKRFKILGQLIET